MFFCKTLQGMPAPTRPPPLLGTVFFFMFFFFHFAFFSCHFSFSFHFAFLYFSFTHFFDIVFSVFLLIFMFSISSFFAFFSFCFCWPCRGNLIFQHKKSRQSHMQWATFLLVFSLRSFRTDTVVQSFFHFGCFIFVDFSVFF